VFFNVYTDGGGKVTVLHPHRSLLTSCSGPPSYLAQRKMHRLVVNSIIQK